MRAFRMLRAWTCVVLATSPTAMVGQAGAPAREGPPAPVYLIIRSDDAGMSHSVNMALQRVMDTGLPLSVSMSKNRQGELNALTSQRFTEALKAHNVHLMTYRELIAKQGLQAMRRPAG